jgi:hypothetical protein
MQTQFFGTLPSLLAGLAAISAVSACSGDRPSAASSGSGIDLTAVRACELLTPNEIEAATGFSVDSGEDATQLGGRLPMCNWARTGSEYDYVASVLVTGGSYSSYEQFVQFQRDSELGDVFEETDVERVDGLGLFGVWLPEVNMLQVYDDDVMVQIHAAAAAAGGELEAAKTLARAALAQLD